MRTLLTARRAGVPSLAALSLSLASTLPLPLVTSGCQSARGAVDTVSSVAADALLPPEQENELGEQLAKEIEAELSMHPDDEVQRYVSRLGDRLVRAARKRGEVPKGIDFTFHVVDDDEQVNAFAIPGGGIYVYSGLLKAAESEAEVAGVLAHEIAHVTERHVAERLVAAYGLSALASLALGENPNLLAQLATQVVGTGVLLKYSRDHEAEADARAIPFLVLAGYNPVGLVTFFDRMAKAAGPTPAAFELLQSHPAPETRIRQAELLIGLLEDKPTYLGKREYAAFKKSV